MATALAGEEVYIGVLRTEWQTFIDVTCSRCYDMPAVAWWPSY